MVYCSDVCAGYGWRERGWGGGYGSHRACIHINSMDKLSYDISTCLGNICEWYVHMYVQVSFLMFLRSTFLSKIENIK